MMVNYKRGEQGQDGGEASSGARVLNLSKQSLMGVFAD